MSNLCWRCLIRKTSYNTQDLKYDNKDSFSTHSCSRNDEKVCFSCSGLLLIDDQSEYCILKIPDEVKKARRRQSNKFALIQNTQTGLIGTYAIYKKSSARSETKEVSIGGYLREVFINALNGAVSNDIGLKVTEIGVSIELTPELRANSDKEMCLSLKSCLRSLLLSQLLSGMDISQNQGFNLRLNQNSDLYINFLFSTRIPANLEFTEGFISYLVVSYNWKNVYMLGRYIKLSRRISQSKWGFSDNGKNKITVDTSIEEVLLNSLKELIQFKKFTFSSSGREDVDVRMLGEHAQAIFDRALSVQQGTICSNQENTDHYPSKQIEDQVATVAGRPFAIEIGNILSHHYLFYPNNVEILNIKNPNFKYYSMNDFIQLFKKTIQQKSNSRVEISMLNFSDSNSVQKMNKEVNEKQKSYRCVCYSSFPINFNEYNLISDHLRFPITLSQKTPVRVLHRRPNMIRFRKIYDLMISPINENYFILDLLAQAGTYIKEFVNGDLGRTTPSLGDLIGDSLPGKSINEERLNVVIIQLDVLNIH